MNLIERIEAGIELHGHFIISVFPNDSPIEMPFSYTVGLSPKFGYELLVIGLSYNTAGVILNDIATKMPILLDTPDLRFTTMPLVFKKCRPGAARDYTRLAAVYYEKPVPVVQVVLCDKNGLFPWQQAYDMPQQPLLYDRT